MLIIQEFEGISTSGIWTISFDSLAVEASRIFVELAYFQQVYILLTGLLFRESWTYSKAEKKTALNCQVSSYWNR
jgi:hypothetical protein